MSRKRSLGETTRGLDRGPQRDPVAVPSGDHGEEIGSLARALARGYTELVDQFHRYAGLGPAEAAQAASTPGEHALDLIQRQFPEDVSWATLSQAVAHDPAATMAAWGRIKSAARDEWRSGHRTAQSLEWAGTPWDRARFLALREAFRREWQPRGGVESALVDLLAQSFGAYLQWSERLSLYVNTQGETEDAKLKQEGYWMPPRLTEARWMTWCAEQATASHRRFLMTLKAMQDLRRLSVVSIATVGQVNIAQQQINVSSDADDLGIGQ